MDDSTRRGIDRVAWGLLREAGITQPPVRIRRILAHLELDRGYYDLSDPGLLRRFWHKVKVTGHKLVEVLDKINLAGVWLPDEQRILVDSSLPEPKRKWASFHDTCHRVLPWHREFFLGDTAQTLDPAYQEMLESEANYAASTLMFCGPVFTREALDTSPEWDSVAQLKQRYDSSFVTTSRRYVEHSHDLSMLMVVSTPHWEEKPQDQPERCRHFVPSPRFRREFSGVTWPEVLRKIDANTVRRSGGPLGTFVLLLCDDNGDFHQFRAESFFNSYYVLTLVVHESRWSPRSFVAPASPEVITDIGGIYSELPALDG